MNTMLIFRTLLSAGVLQVATAASEAPEPRFLQQVADDSKRYRARLRAWGFSLFLWLAFGAVAGSSQAAILTVTNLADSGPGTLRDAIAAGAVGDTIDLEVTGAIALTSGALVLDKNLSIVGPGPKLLAIGDCFSRVFVISAGAHASISGLTIRNGSLPPPQPFNLPDSGGGIWNVGSLMLSNCMVTGHALWGGKIGATRQGGGIFNSGTLALISCQVSDNGAAGGMSFGGAGGTGQGGGIFNFGTLSLISCLISSNSASGGCGASGNGAAAGGGIANLGALTMTNCTLIGNSCYGGGILGSLSPGGNADGGAVWSDGPSATLISCTLSGNSTTGGAAHYSGNASGGGIAFAGALTLLNCLIAGNGVVAGAGGWPPGIAGQARGPDVYGGVSVSSLGFNLMGQADDSSGWVSSDQLGSKAAPLNPLLGPLQNNGGLTLTLLPQPLSPAIDRGTSAGVAVDQRGVPRPCDLPSPGYPNAAGGDGSDVGAVEVACRLATSATGGGKVFVDPALQVFPPGSQVRLYAVPMDGWTFIGWSGDASGSNNPLTTSMDGDKTVGAVFTCAVPSLIMDNPEAIFVGNWATDTDVSFPRTCYGSNFRTCAADGGGETATYPFDMTGRSPGNYDLYTWYYSSNSNTLNALYQVVRGDPSSPSLSFHVNQSTDGGRWILVGESFALPGGASGVAIIISNDVAQAGRTLVADAVKFSWSSHQPLVPLIKSIVTDGTRNFTVTWFAEPDVTYRLQSTSSLTNSFWTDVPGDVLGNGDSASKSDTPTRESQRFYRVLRL